MDFRRSWLRTGQHVWDLRLPPGFRGGTGGKGLGRGAAHILVSLVPDETIFWMRSWPSSVLSSASCFVKSSLLLSQSWTALTLLDD